MSLNIPIRRQSVYSTLRFQQALLFSAGLEMTGRDVGKVLCLVRTLRFVFASKLCSHESYRPDAVHQ
jgi:hypothetical protein